MRILIIEEDETLSKTLSDTLTQEGYQNDLAENLSDARYYLDIRNYDLVLLAWPAATEKNLDIITTIKTEAHKTSVIVLSEREDKESEIKALRSGADDFIRKPLDDDILKVRIEAKLRFGVSNIIEIEDLIINPEEEKIIYQGEEIELKGKPFEVLYYLAKNRTRYVTKDELLDTLWDEPEELNPNIVEVSINGIRKHLDKPFKIQVIGTIRKYGYQFIYEESN